MPTTTSTLATSCAAVASQCIGSPDCDIKLTLDGNVVSPYVRVVFSKQGISISVGNESSPELMNHTIVKEFDYGFTDGTACRLTIASEIGSDFDGFVKEMAKDITRGGLEDMTMIVKFGWIIKDCNNNITTKLSEDILFIPSNVTETIERGVIKFQIEGLDPMTHHGQESRNERTFGEDGRFKRLKQAINEMWQSEPAPKVPVDFRLKAFNVGGADGPWGTWPTSGQTKLGATQRWLAPYRSVNGKGIVVFFDNGGSPKIVIDEDPLPSCDQVSANASCLGTYLVNAGACSPVLQFNTRMQWNWQMLRTSGGTVGGIKQAAEKNKGNVLCGDLMRDSYHESAGMNSYNASSQNAEHNYGTEANKEIEASKVANLFASPIYRPSIEAEMVVQGDPSIDHRLKTWGKYVNIVYINPFHLDGAAGKLEDTKKCSEWIASPVCNRILTNKRWYLRGVHHYISEGSFVTTINMQLLAGGERLNRGSPLGGPGSGGPSL